MSKTAAKDARTRTSGLTVERRFTTAGVHPFDEVEWELRDAVIGDPESPAFEQRGIEFPPSGPRTRPTSSPRSTSGASSGRRSASAP